MRFGLMVNGPKLQQWQYYAVQRLIDDGHEPVLALMRNGPKSRASLFGKLYRYPYKNLLYRLWQRYIFRPDAKKELDISDLLDKMKVIECIPEVRGTTEWIPEETAPIVKELKLDFMLRFGFNIVRGTILDAPTYGIWSFHHDDEQLIRGGPPGFWEVYHNHDVNGVILQRLTDKLDAGPVIGKIWLPVIKHSYKAHFNQILSESAFLPAKACRSIIRHGMKAETCSKKGKLYRNPHNEQMLRLFLTMPLRRIYFHLHQLLRQESWRIGVSNTSLSHLGAEPPFVLGEMHWVIHPDPAHYYADPFALNYRNQNIILAEHFNYKTGKGQLVRLLPEEGFRAVPVHCPGNYHWSFPFLLDYKAKVYCLPECHTSGRLTIYEFDPQQNRLDNPVVLLSDVEALDPVLIEHHGLWWLLFSQKNMPGVQLFGWYAESPFGPYMPHPLNPLKTDPRSARNAGAPYIHEGKLIRPAQDCSGAYGRAVVLCRIDKLTPDDFLETEIGRIVPERQWTYNSGLHTLNANSDLLLVDAKTYRFSWAGLWHTWKLKTRKTR